MKMFFKNLIINNLSWYLFYTLLHYICAHSYIYFCAPRGFIGFIQSIFYAQTTQCQVILWTMNKTAENMTIATLLFISIMKDLLFSKEFKR